MKKITTVIMGIFMCLLFTVPVFAAEIEPKGAAIVDRAMRGSIYIDYKDTDEGTDPVTGAEFTFYKVAELSDSGGYISLINGIKTFDEDDDLDNVLETVKNAYSEGCDGQIYKAVTDDYGTASVRDAELGLYIAEESQPAEEHFASAPFYVALPYTEDNTWVYTVTANPKALPGGDLMISKTVTGEKGDKDKEWHFTITLTDSNGDEYAEPVDYIKSDGTKGTTKSGDVISLKHGETATIKCIPVGTDYTVVETEADSDGYITSSTGSSGKIMRKNICTASFTNRADVATGDSYTFYIQAGLLTAFLIAMTIIILRTVKMKKEDADDK